MRLLPSSDALRTLVGKLPRPERSLTRTVVVDAYSGWDDAEDDVEDETDLEVLERLRNTGRLAGNAILLGGAQYIADQIGQVKFCVAEELPGDNNWKFFPDHEASQIVLMGNQWDDGTDVIGEAVMDYLDGNAYFYCLDVRGRPESIWWRPARNMRLGSNRRNPLAFYEYIHRAGSKKGDRIDPKNIIHIKHKISSVDPRLGRPVYLSAFREIDADNEAARVIGEVFRYSLMSNTIFQWRKENGLPLTEGERRDFQAAVRSAIGRTRRGSPAFSGEGELIVHEIKNHLSDIKIKEHRDNFEARILIGLKIQSIVLGLQSGPDFPSKEVFLAAERDSWNKGIIPIMEDFEKAFTKQFLHRRWPEAKRRGWQFKFDISAVEALREDYQTQLERDKIWTDRLLAGGCSLGAYKDGIGIPKEEGDDDIYYLPIDHIITKKSDILKVSQALVQSNMDRALGGAAGDPNSTSQRRGRPTNETRRD